MERAVLQEPPYRSHQLLVRHRTARPGPPALERLRPVAMAVDGRSRHAPDPCHPLQAVDLVRRGRDPSAHRLDLLGTKGRLDPSCSILASSNSLAIVRSPTFSLRRPISASRALVGRVFNDASPAARKAPRQLLRSAAVTPSRRDSTSRSSPRSSLSTAFCLRHADIRPRRSGVDPPAPAWWARSDGSTPVPTSSSILHLLAVLYLQSGVSKYRRPGKMVADDPPREISLGPQASRHPQQHPPGPGWCYHRALVSWSSCRAREIRPRAGRPRRVQPAGLRRAPPPGTPAVRARAHQALGCQRGGCGCLRARDAGVQLRPHACAPERAQLRLQGVEL